MNEATVSDLTHYPYSVTHQQLSSGRDFECWTSLDLSTTTTSKPRRRRRTDERMEASITQCTMTYCHQLSHLLLLTNSNKQLLPSMLYISSRQRLVAFPQVSICYIYPEITSRPLPKIKAGVCRPLYCCVLPPSVIAYSNSLFR
jgi:hypothetical protein